MGASDLIPKGGLGTLKKIGAKPVLGINWYVSA